MRISDWSSDVCSSDLVRAWVKISTVFPARADTPDRRRFEAAVADMPEEMRQIFLAHALDGLRSEEQTSELQSLMRISYAVFCLKKKNQTYTYNTTAITQTQPEPDTQHHAQPYTSNTRHT